MEELLNYIQIPVWNWSMLSLMALLLMPLDSLVGTYN